ncbi:MAG: methionyl-tRNA formyltransferase [Tissierellia bacterium]|nr:methionyl-tRNA formyltransferase [Tissierellia bacterium]
MKIVFMGTPDFAVPSLCQIHNSNYHITLVVSQVDWPRGRGKKLQYTPVKEKAIELGLEVYQPANINSESSIEKLRQIKPDLIVVVAYGQILSEEILQLPKYGCINVHASLLPKYRGAAPINWAIINGEKETGVTIMQMEKGLDTGDIILKSSIEIKEEDDYISIHDKLSHLGGVILIKAIKDIFEGVSKKTAQDHNKSNYAPMIFKSTGKIDWNKSSHEIRNLVQGLKPWPTAYTDYDGQTIKIHKARTEIMDETGEVGEIIKVSDDGIYIQTGDKILVIEEIQFPNKKKMLVKDYLAGNTIKENKILS